MSIPKIKYLYLYDIEKIYVDKHLSSEYTECMKRTKKEVYVSDHPLYSIWSAMRHRCDTNRKGYEKVAVCEAWKRSFYKFLDDMGPRPPGYQIDRIDNNKGYFKENCRWASPRTNNNNRSDNKRVKYLSFNLTYSQWSRVLSIHRNGISERARKGTYTSVEILFGKKNRKTFNPLSEQEITKRIHNIKA